jgi:hypothetical protein
MEYGHFLVAELRMRPNLLDQLLMMGRDLNDMRQVTALMVPIMKMLCAWIASVPLNAECGTMGPAPGHLSARF